MNRLIPGIFDRYILRLLRLIAFRDRRQPDCIGRYGDRDRAGRGSLDLDGQFSCFTAVIILRFNIKGICSCRRRRAGNLAGAFVQAQAFRQGAVGNSPRNRRRTVRRKGLAVVCAHRAARQVLGRNGRRVLHAVAQGILDALVHRAAVHNHAAAVRVQAGVFSQRQALARADGQILLQFHLAVHGAFRAVKDDAGA